MAKKKQSEDKMKIGVMNGEIANDFYNKAPCTIGYSYVRFEVEGTIKGCCIARHKLGDTKDANWQEAWNSGQYDAFRSKMKCIAKDRFHLRDPEWGFCQQCSHRGINELNFELLQTPFETANEPRKRKSKNAKRA